jgi:UDP-N-acetylmuramate--alanine ligase
MTDLKNIEGFYFIGIGGIGMSALALYFSGKKSTIAGYDRTETGITRFLSSRGCEITYEDSLENIPVFFRNAPDKNKVLIVYTPAIPSDNQIFSFFRDKGFRMSKRSEVLGEISSHTDTIAVSGTHGKTTVSTMTAHLLKQSHVDCSAFLGGISKNYNSNLLTGYGKYTVMEADEFDRSFQRLDPQMAVVTSVDPDHLDIYGDQQTMIDAYNIFCSKIRKGGKLFINNKIKKLIKVPEGVVAYTYGTDEESDYRSSGIKRFCDYYSFNLQTPDELLRDLHFPFPGIINIENLTAAIAVAMNCGVTEQEIRKSIIFFQGVRRRFDIRINLPGLAYIDDYAHHPEEIRAFITSVREYFMGRRITGIFQPHLFSRTRDHAEGFAAILDKLDEAILLPIYPAREKPVPGITSEIIYNKMRLRRKRMMKMEDIPDSLNFKELDVLVTIGAGDIDKLAEPIEEKIKKSYGI